MGYSFQQQSAILYSEPPLISFYRLLKNGKPDLFIKQWKKQDWKSFQP